MYLVDDRNPQRIPNAKLKQFAEQMLDVADSLTHEAFDLLINSLPDQCRPACVVKLRIYMGIGKHIRSSSCYERRAKISKIGKISIAMKCMYFTSRASPNECDKQKV